MPGPSQGLLFKPEAESRIRLQRYAPSPDLAWCVAHHWMVDWDLEGLPPLQRHTLPHPNVHLFVQPDQEGVMGVPEGRFEANLVGKGRVYGIKFLAGGYHPFHGRSVAELSGRVLPLPEAFGEAGEAYVAAVRAAPDHDHLVALGEAFLRERLPESPDPLVAELEALVQAIAQNPGLMRVEALAQRSGRSVRSLQRLFQERVGVGPKWVICRFRIFEALDRIQAGEGQDWSRLALDLGYFDQAHFSKDFKALVGQAPSAFAGQWQGVT